jgi:hypothetical protein
MLGAMQIGGPSAGFSAAFAGGYWDEAGFGVTSAVDRSTYGQGKPNITRTLFTGYNAVKSFYNASSSSGSELYLTGEQLAAIQSEIRDQIHEDRKELHELCEIDVPHEASIRRLLQAEIAVLHARLAFPTDEVLQQLDEMLDTRTSLSRVAKRHVHTQLHARLTELQPGG